MKCTHFSFTCFFSVYHPHPPMLNIVFCISLVKWDCRAFFSLAYVVVYDLTFHCLSQVYKNNFRVFFAYILTMFPWRRVTSSGSEALRLRQTFFFWLWKICVVTDTSMLRKMFVFYTKPKTKFWFRFELYLKCTQIRAKSAFVLSMKNTFWFVLLYFEVIVDLTFLSM